MVVAVSAAGVLSAATVLTGLITNEASAQQRWPGALEVVRTHPWHSLGVLALLLVGLTIVMAALPARDTGGTANDEAPGHTDLVRPAVAVIPSGRAAETGPVPIESPPDDQRLARLSASLVSRLGRRRTAYPLDLSLAELHRAGLFVPGRVACYHERDADTGEQTVSALVARLRGGESVLLLGEPGSGKSLSLYGVALDLQEAGLLPVPLRALDALEVTDDLRGSGLQLAALPDAVLLIDGLDEASDLTGDGPPTTALLEFLQHAPVLVTSRTREYEEWIAFETTTVSFDEVFVLRSWSVDREFADYLTRLQGNGLIADPELYRTVVASERLTRLVTRPLYARMLTFIGPDAATRVSSASNLYGEYLNRLGRATDFAVRSSCPGWAGRSLTVWQSAAWFVHEQELPPDAIPMVDLHTALTSDRGRGPRSGRSTRWSTGALCTVVRSASSSTTRSTNTCWPDTSGTACSRISPRAVRWDCCGGI